MFDHYEKQWTLADAAGGLTTEDYDYVTLTDRDDGRWNSQDLLDKIYNGAPFIHHSAAVLPPAPLGDRRLPGDGLVASLCAI